MKKFVAFLKRIWNELILRWTSKSPHLFKLIQRLSTVFASLSGLMILLQSLNVELPGALSWLSDKVVIISAILTWLVAKLPVDMDHASDETKKAIETSKPNPDVPE